MQADARFLQKIGIEVGIDSACTLTAELVARGAAALGAEWVYVCDDLVTTVLLVRAPRLRAARARGAGVGARARGRGRARVARRARAAPRERPRPWRCVAAQRCARALTRAPCSPPRRHAQDVAMVSILAPSAAKVAAAGAGEQPSSGSSGLDESRGSPADTVAHAHAGASSDAHAATRAAAPADGASGGGGGGAGALAAAFAEASSFVASLPNSAFEAAPPAPHPGYSLAQRAGAAAWTAALYGALGLVCGGAGQARAPQAPPFAHDAHFHSRAPR
jgi:hypothetical protein